MKMFRFLTSITYSLLLSIHHLQFSLSLFEEHIFLFFGTPNVSETMYKKNVLYLLRNFFTSENNIIIINSLIY